MSISYASFWARFLAYLIDSLIIYVIVMPLGYITGIIIGFTSISLGSNSEMVALVSQTTGSAIGIITFICYYSLFEQSSWQGTIGKLLLGLKVVDEHGSKISLLRAFVRTISKYLSAFLFLIGYMMAAFTVKKQALHDLIANVYVIQKK